MVWKRADGPPVPEPPPWSFWRRPDLPKDRCNMTGHFRNLENLKKLMIKQILCERWTCARCGPMVKRKWRYHLSGVIAKIAKIYLCTRKRRNWSACHRRIRRLKGQYCRVELADGTLAIFTNVAVGELVPPELRPNFLKAVVDAACFRGHAISTSRAWKLKPKPKKKPEWSHEGWLPGTLEDARKVIADLELTARNGGSYTVTEVPESWLEDDERGLKNLRLHLERGPSQPEAGESEQTDAQDR